MDTLEHALHESLTAFGHRMLDQLWYGKEREAVSYYAFGYLVDQCRAGSRFYNPGQIAIEGRVPGGALNAKKEVCKDLVIWAHPGGNCWDPKRRSIHYPLVIMEWKANSEAFFPYDMDYLKNVTGQEPGLLGIAVTFDARKKQLFRAAKVLFGEVQEDWLNVRALR